MIAETRTKIKFDLQTFKFGAPRYSHILNVLFVVYVSLLPFSNAFTVHTGPLVLLLFWVLEGDFKNKFEKLRSQKTIWFLLSFFAFSILSLLWTDNMKEGLHYLKYYFVITIVLVTMYTSLKKQYALPVLLAFFTSVFVTELSLYGWYLKIWHLKGTTGVLPLQNMNRIMYSIFLVTATFLSLWQLLKKENSLWVRIVSSVFFLSTLFSLFIGYSRTGQLAFLLGFIMFVFIYWKEKKRYFIIACLVLIVFVGAAYSFSSPFKQRVETTITDIKNINHDNLRGSWGIRIAAKIVAVNTLKLHPVVGSGIGDFNDDFHQSAMAGEMKSYAFVHHLAHPHDQFLVIILQTGMIGLTLFILFLWMLFKTNVKSNLDKAVLWSLLTVFIVTFLSDFALQNYITGLFAFVIGYLLNSYRDI